jgi:hypothetical protein
MLDAKLRPLIDPPLNRAGAWIAARGVHANTVTLIGIALGLLAAAAIYLGMHGLAILSILCGRLMDGLDGAVARANEQVRLWGISRYRRGFHVLRVLCPSRSGFRIRQIAATALILVGSFALTGVSFLAFAAVAAEQGLGRRTTARRAFSIPPGLQRARKQSWPFC